MRKRRQPLRTKFEEDRNEHSKEKKLRKQEDDILKAAKNELPDIEDSTQLEHLDKVQKSWDNTPRSSQSDDCIRHILNCFDSGLDEGQIKHYLLQKEVDTESRISYALNLVNPGVLSFVDDASKRNLLPPSERVTKIQELTTKLDLNDNGLPKNNFPITRTNMRKQNPVYGLPLNLIKSNSNNGVLNVEDIPSFVERHQVRMLLNDKQMTDFNTKATHSADFNITMQDLLNNESPYDEEYYWYQGVQYINRVDAPDAIMDKIKKECPHLHRLLNVSHIGESCGDLMLFRKKMINELVYLAGATLIVDGVLIPFGFCTSYTLEQSCHVVNLKERVGGELYGDIDAPREVDAVCVRVGGGVHFQTSISLDGDELSEPVKKDTLGSLYAWCIALESDELEALEQIWQSLDGDCVKERKYLEWLLAWKLGCSENNVMQRIKKAFWVWACSLRYIARDNVPDVYKAERELQRTYDKAGLRVGGERFKLGSSEFQKLREEWGGNDLDDKNFHSSDKVERTWNKCTYREREVKLFLALGLVELSHIVDLVMDGVIELTF